LRAFGNAVAESKRNPWTPSRAKKAEKPMTSGSPGLRAAPAAAFAMQPGLPAALFGEEGLAALATRLDLVSADPVEDLAALGRAALARIEVLVTGWGAPAIGAAELASMPRLRAVFHAAGTVKGHLDPAVWERGVRVTTAARANAYPVAEYTLGMILLEGKGVLRIAEDYRTEPLEHPLADYPDIGNYRRTVGIVSASAVGRRVIQLLAPFDLRVLLYDPLLSDDDPILALAERVELAELLRGSSIVSVHAPLLPETRGLIGAAELALMPDGATLINTARAPIVDEAALAAELAARRLRAVLDVTEPEPLPLDHPLRSAPGVLLTPHVAGALGNELRRLGASVLDEVERFVRGEPAGFPVRQQDLRAMA